MDVARILLSMSIIAFIGVAMAPAGEAWHGAQRIYYRSAGPLDDYEPLHGHCSVDVIPPQVDCDPVVDTSPADTFVGSSSSLRWNYYHHVVEDTWVTVRFHDALNDEVMFKVDGNLCVVVCGVMLQNHDGDVTISIDPLDFTGAELISHALPTSGYFDIVGP